MCLSQLISGNSPSRNSPSMPTRDTLYGKRLFQRSVTRLSSRTLRCSELLAREASGLSNSPLGVHCVGRRCNEAAGAPWLVHHRALNTHRGCRTGAQVLFGSSVSGERRHDERGGARRTTSDAPRRRTLQTACGILCGAACLLLAAVRGAETLFNEISVKRKDAIS